MGPRVIGVARLGDFGQRDIGGCVEVACGAQSISGHGLTRFLNRGFREVASRVE